jgi:UDP-N-acetylglucosamine 2-epimerase (non-hydrolysing)
MITIVYGTRPEAIKLWSVVKALRAGGADLKVICTGQHRELLDGTFDLEPDISPDLMQPDQKPSDFVAGALRAIESHLRGSKQLVVQGDTATAFAAALTAFHQQIPVAHVEAGLRTHKLNSPFPEEGYRRMIDRISSRLYAPTEMAKENLLSELPELQWAVQPPLRTDIPRVLVTGNPGIDAALAVPEGEEIRRGKFALVTVHRREAFGKPLAAIVRAVRRIAESIPILWPVHPNPQVRETVWAMLGQLANVHLIDPLPYPALIGALRAARFVLTDSGGIQEEAPTFGVPALVVREVTERPEAIEAGASELVGFEEDTIVNHALRLIESQAIYQSMAIPRMLYGDGHAGERIAKDLLEAL